VDGSGRKTVRLFLGFALLFVGIVGLLLPVMPGWIFVIPGLLILSEYFPPIRRLTEWAKARARRAGVAVHDPKPRDPGADEPK